MTKKVSLYYFQWSNGCTLPNFHIHRIYLPYLCFLDDKNNKTLEQYKKRGIELVGAMPAITKGFHDYAIKANWKTLTKSPYLDAMLISNLGQLDMFKDRGIPLYADSGMNIFNSSSMDLMKRYNIQSMTLSYELTEIQISEIQNHGIELEKVIYGRVPVMHSEYCPLDCKKKEGQNHEKLDQRQYYLKDRVDENNPIISDCKSCSIILLSSRQIQNQNSIRVKNENITYYRFNVYNENVEAINEWYIKNLP